MKYAIILVLLGFFGWAWASSEKSYTQEQMKELVMKAYSIGFTKGEASTKGTCFIDWRKDDF